MQPVDDVQKIYYLFICSLLPYFHPLISLSHSLFIFPFLPRIASRDGFSRSARDSGVVSQSTNRAEKGKCSPCKEAGAHREHYYSPIRFAVLYIYPYASNNNNYTTTRVQRRRNRRRSRKRSKGKVVPI